LCAAPQHTLLTLESGEQSGRPGWFNEFIDDNDLLAHRICELSGWQPPSASSNPFEPTTESTTDPIGKAGRRVSITLIDRLVRVQVPRSVLALSIRSPGIGPILMYRVLDLTRCRLIHLCKVFWTIVWLTRIRRECCPTRAHRLLWIDILAHGVHRDLDPRPKVRNVRQLQHRQSMT
jgi:hypothetical protein